MSLDTKSTVLPVLALRGLVVFPGMLLHFDVGRDKSISAINIAMERDQMIFLIPQKELKTEDPTREDLFDIGCVARVRQTVRLSDDSIRVLIEGKYRASFKDLRILNNSLVANINKLDDKAAPKNTAISVAMIRKVQDIFEKYSALLPRMPKDILVTVASAEDPGYLGDYIASNIQLSMEDKQMVIEELNPIKRLRVVSKILNKEWQILNLDAKINDKAKEYLDDNQREYYLREQMHAISNELYGDAGPEAEADEYRLKIEDSGAPLYAKNTMKQEANKLAKMPVGSHEATVVRNYLDMLLALPWSATTKTSNNIFKAEKILNKEHYGLVEVKNRILDLLAVSNLNPDINGQIICLAGPPGVGKTSIAKSLANCMNRKFARVSLGGVHDEAEIVGHRKTYIGAMPGRIIKAIKSAGSSNPLILLDEVDKMSADMKGDPASALLEVLDSEQNHSFVDHYIDIPFDLSGVLFVCTANNLSNIPGPLLDRMDIIELPGYTRIDKFHIAKEHLIPKQLKKHGLDGKKFKIYDSALYDVIDYYTMEAGVRKLENSLAQIMRKSTRIFIENQKIVTVTSQNLNRFLGPKKYFYEEITENNEVGIVNGLAWTEVGGKLMQLEVSVINGRGALELTGSLGDVMKESAKAAVSFVRANADYFNIPDDFYKNKDIHIHATEAAVPKDGPSAGVAITIALISALTGRRVRSNVAMTGEITILGRVFAIGGLKEKTLAALRSGIDTVIIPKHNQKDIESLDNEVKEAIKFQCVSSVFEAVDIALEKQKNTIGAKKIDNYKHAIRI